ncbi:MAG TPA: SRPBCC family protein [Haliangiales bacterium]|nr:SRPBCC family protein [Haliangiales bacterium]
MQNVHSRRVAAPIERVRPWIEACWSGGARDCFPRDVIHTWRRNPPGADPSALIPGETMVGHGPFRFRLRAWDGRTWRVDVVGGTAGWHGFDLAPDGDGCRVTHTLELEGSLAGRLRWMAIAPIHNWAVEALFDRLEHALATGAPPARTERPMSRAAAWGLALARRGKSRTGNTNRQQAI